MLLGSPLLMMVLLILMMLLVLLTGTLLLVLFHLQAGAKLRDYHLIRTSMLMLLSHHRARMIRLLLCC
uniref:Putative secreted peptide n=1 Tax=Anopheles braziliensis TaxID=58242 RepID=A0A2M3ZUB0_9DIPT